MSQIEKIFLLALCLAPILALIFIVPWKKIFMEGLSTTKEKPVKEKKVKETPVKVRPIKTKKAKAKYVDYTSSTYQQAEYKAEDKNLETETEEKEEHQVVDRGFAEYLQSRRRRSNPARGFDRMSDADSSRDFTKPFNPFAAEEHRSFDYPTQNEEKTISEELQTISPELKALIISGALDRKNFDDNDNK
jgi:hypothetical protein